MSTEIRVTQYGFQFGVVEVTRLCSDKGRVWISLKTARDEVQVYVTRTGLIREFRRDKVHGAE
jgi:hypothetical protein